MGKMNVKYENRNRISDSEHPAGCMRKEYINIVCFMFMTEILNSVTLNEKKIAKALK